MRILILTNSDSGLYQFRKELIEELLRQNNEVFIASPGAEYISTFERMGCVFFSMEFNRHGTNPFADLGQVITYVNLIKRIHPNAVLTYTIKPNIYGGIACRLMGIPYIANITGLGTAVENKGPLQTISLTLYRLGLRKANMVFFQNRANRDFMLRHRVIHGNYDLLPGSGVNLTRFKPAPYPGEEEVHFLFVARIMQAKGIDQFLDAAGYFHETNSNVRFHVCGSCEEMYQKQLDELHQKGVIQYHGSVNDMLPMYKMASCLIHPTFYSEGMSNVLLEACACGRPIITTDRPGCREIVDDGINGFTVKQRDSRDLIEKIEKFLSLPWEKRRDMGLAGRAKVEREFDRNIVVNKYLGEIKRAGL